MSGRRTALILAWLALWLVLGLHLALAGAQEVRGAAPVAAVESVGITVADMDRSLAFYPAIELLEYLAPRDGRPFPADARANDLVHRQVRVVGADAGAAARRLGGLARLVSPGVVTVPEGRLGFRRGVLLRDPDGHAVQVVER